MDQPYALSADLHTELRGVLGASISNRLLEDIRFALSDYKTLGLDLTKVRRTQSARLDAVRRIHTQALALRRALRRAEATFAATALSKEASLSSPVLPKWPDLTSSLDSMIEVSRLWIARATRRKRTKGRQRDWSRSVLRLEVFEALDRSGVPITRSGKGQAAKVLALVLQEADSLEGVSVRARLDFKGRDWGSWLNEYKELCAEGKSIGGLPASIVLGLKEITG